MSTKRENGVALITALLVLFLVSAMIVGMSWMVMTDQRLGGNNANREVAFYGAEAGMEKMTADLGNLFSQKGSLSASDITSIVDSQPTVPGINYVNSFGQSTYNITYQGQPGNPVSTTGSILAPSPYAGLNALVTNYTLTVTADTPTAGEVQLQRIVQTSDIPVFQFGIFSNVDLGFHAGDDFIFGGRVHTNGNLWLAAGTGDWLELPSKVTTAKEIVTSTLMNGLPNSLSWSGAVDISNGSTYQNLDTQTPAQSISGTTWNIQTLNAAEASSTYTYNTKFSSLASSTYAGNIGVKETGVTPLNLSIVTSNLGGQAIDLIRMPVPNEAVSNPAKLGLRYYSLASLRILLSDYGPSGTCSDSDISPGAANPLPYISASTPIDLAGLAWYSADGGSSTGNANDPTMTAAPPYTQPPTWLSGVGTNVFPLPLSAAGSTSYTASANGYWVRQYQPVITGCLKIDYQSGASADTFTDVTKTILNLGYTGPELGTISVPKGKSYSSYDNPVEPSGVSAATCSSISPNSVIRLARLRDNPTTGSSGGCGTATTNGTDYWPNVLFDAREAMLRDGQVPSLPTLAGTMYYVELDIGNLSKCLTGALAPCAAFSGSVNNTTGYTVYFSDRRGDRPDPTPPASIPPASGTSAKTGAFGYEDFVNESSAANGCPNGTLDQGEDVESDYDQNGNSLNVGTTPRTYGALPILYTYINGGGNAAVTSTWANWAMSNIPTSTAGEAFSSTSVAAAVLSNNTNCSGPGKNWPFAMAANGQDLRQNPPLIFRRALKLVDGKTISLGTCNTVVCGLTVASENPVYVQGDYNNPGAPANCTSFTQCFPNPDTAGGGIPASIAADAITVLSNAWNDVNSFNSPYSISGRTAASQTTYRTAVVSGKPIGFPNPSGTTSDTGSDGGVHNFLRYLEDWGGSNIWYEGSFVALYYNHQADGSFKCCSGDVYGIPGTRNMQFDSTFLNPLDLPPRTPMLRGVNTIGFTQELMPTQ